MKWTNEKPKKRGYYAHRRKGLVHPGTHILFMNANGTFYKNFLSTHMIEVTILEEDFKEIEWLKVM